MKATTFGRPRTPKGELAANMQVGQFMLFDTDIEALRFKDCVRWYHGNRSVSINKVPRIGWRVSRKSKRERIRKMMYYDWKPMIVRHLGKAYAFRARLDDKGRVMVQESTIKNRIHYTRNERDFMRDILVKVGTDKHRLILQAAMQQAAYEWGIA